MSMDKSISVVRDGWSISSILLLLFGALLVLVGVYFIVIRPALLPEDLRYLGTSRTQIEAVAPHLATWLGHVFRVLGGYIIATGILTMALAVTAYRQHSRGAAIAAAAAGAASIGLMVAVNFSINSDFKWVLSGIAGLWALSILWYAVEVLRVDRTVRDAGVELPVTLRGYERHYSESVTLAASAEDVFAFADDFTRLSSHMGKSSMMMMRTSMQTSLDEGRGKAIGSHIQMAGRMLGLNLFLDEVVRLREPPRHKEWETVGTPRLLVIARYRLGFDIVATDNRTSLRVFIGYDLPTSPLQRVLGIILGPLYARWCVTRMVDGAESAFGQGAKL